MGTSTPTPGSDGAGGGAPAEVAATLDGPVPRSLGFLDQGAFWANLGVSLLGFAGVLAVLAPGGAPPLTITAAIVATVVGTLVGSAMVGLSAMPGAATGAPAMVLLRGLFGGVLSWIPSVLNVVQLIGWGTFELVVIAQAGTLALGGPTWAWVLGAGIVTTLLTLRPLGMLRLLRRVVTILVAISVAYLAWWLFSRWLSVPGAAGVSELDLGVGGGSWAGFWAGADAAIAVAVSWIPVASDFSRHSRRVSTAFTSATVGYGVTQIVCFVVGLAALALVGGDGDEVFTPMLAAPFGLVALLVLTARETDQSFANVYSTAVSVQNLAPRADRRLLCLGIGAVITVLALGLTIDDYAVFLAAIGSVFVPLLGVGVGDALVRRGRAPDLSRWAPSRPSMVVAWVVGLVVYQMINPGGAPVWSDAWTGLRGAIGFTPPSWLSASLSSFLVAALVAVVLARREKSPIVTSGGDRKV